MHSIMKCKGTSILGILLLLINNHMQQSFACVFSVRHNWAFSFAEDSQVLTLCCYNLTVNCRILQKLL